MSDRAQVHTFSDDFGQLPPAAISIGAFDGVHAGHAHLLDSLVVDASFRGVPSVALTFDPDPDEVIPGRTPAPKLMTHEARVDALAASGVDHVVVIPFTPEVAALGPEEFLDTVLARITEPRAIHVGEDFRFGYRAQGTVHDLYVWGKAHGCAIHAYPLLGREGESVTATRIRGLIEAAELETAAAFLGHVYSVRGEVVHGRGEGHAIGFPTANIMPPVGTVVPGDGVYAGYVTLEDGARYKAAINVGAPPTFEDAKRQVEPHLVDFNGDLYGQTITVDFVRRLRPQQSFGSLAELKAAILDSVEQARKLP